jgi:hypothetical protein
MRNNYFWRGGDGQIDYSDRGSGRFVVRAPPDFAVGAQRDYGLQPPSACSNRLGYDAVGSCLTARP